MSKTFTKGNIIIEDIEIGDIHFEYYYNLCVKSKVISKPVYDEEHELWEWQNEKFSDGSIINYAVNPKYSHYSPNLYNYEAYSGCRMI